MQQPLLTELGAGSTNRTIGNKTEKNYHWEPLGTEASNRIIFHFY